MSPADRGPASGDRSLLFVGAASGAAADLADALDADVRLTTPPTPGRLEAPEAERAEEGRAGPARADDGPFDWAWHWGATIERWRAAAVDAAPVDDVVVCTWPSTSVSPESSVPSVSSVSATSA